MQTLNYTNILRSSITGFALSIAFFLIWPQTDLHVTQFFYDNAKRAFYFEQHTITDFIYWFTSIIAFSILISIPLLLISSFILKKSFLIQHRRAFVFLISCFIIGPGLLVNSLFKDNWERPRPYQTIDFGGVERFEPPFQPRFECSACYSFVSGHASVGFYFFAFALLLRKKRWYLFAIILGTIIGGTRILQGGHFLSDVIFSGWVIWFNTLLLYYLFFDYKNKALNH